MKLKEIKAIKNEDEQKIALVTFFKDSTLKGLIISLTVIVMTIMAKSKIVLMLLFNNQPILQIAIGIYLGLAIGILIYYIAKNKIISLKKEMFFAGFVDTITSIVISFCVVYVLMIYVITPTSIEGNSMEPTFHDGDRIMIFSLAYEPFRDDVSIIYIENEDEFYIKRIVGLPNEIIIHDPITKTITIGSTVYSQNIDHWMLSTNTLVLGEDEYFVLGDNIDNSRDSRILGPIKRKDIIGQVFFRFWPNYKFGDELD